MDVRMELSRILITEYGDQQVIFLKETDGERAFPIIIGINEALAIDRRLKERPTPRPMTHELLANTIDALGGRLERIVINDVRDHIFIATIHISRDGQSITVDSRPSDAIALGIAFDTPIYVAEKVLHEATRDDAQSRLDLLRRRLIALRERMEEFDTRLTDESFLAQAPDEVVTEARQELERMRTEYAAIERILAELG